MSKLTDLILAVIILVGALHVGVELIHWLERTNSPLDAVAIQIERAAQ